MTKPSSKSRTPTPPHFIWTCPTGRSRRQTPSRSGSPSTTRRWRTAACTTCLVPTKQKSSTTLGSGLRSAALFDVYPEWRDVSAQPCPVPAGGALFHNGLTFHGAGANMTPGLRRAMTCAYMPDGCTFNGTANVLPPDYLATLKVGDLLDYEAQNPLVYSRRQQARHARLAHKVAGRGACERRLEVRVGL